MKKSSKIFVMLLLMFIILPINVSAKTLGELKEEYNALEEQYSSTGDSITATESEISSAKSRIESIYVEMDEAEEEIQQITNEIAKLNESITEKDEQTKELMKFFQVSQGESTYLEYIFSADSITDFIYRITVTEQLSKYNDQLIDEMNSMIEENNQNIDQLHEKEKSLQNLQTELSEKLIVLASERESLYEEYQTIEEEIESAKSVLEYYTKAGCKDNQDISTCATAQLPAGTKFWRPTTSGYITSEYGYRIHPIYGYNKLHTGIDIGCGSLCDRKIYSISDGKVAYTGYNSSMGNYIVIHHNINGNNYSSVYMHLAAIYASKGDIVTKDTVIGYMGTTGSSTGIHLHLSIYTGLYLAGSASLVNPRDYINFPSVVKSGSSYPIYYDKTTYYE